MVASSELNRSASNDQSGRNLENGRALETRAAVAATWLARQQLERFGRSELHQAGFRDALQVALSDPRIGEWDYRKGIQAGRSDPRAAEIGIESGTVDARLAAEKVAFEHVQAEFRHLNEAPLFAPRSTAPDHAMAPPKVRAPRLSDIFDAYPLVSYQRASAAVAEQMLADPWMLYRSETYADFYDDDWQKPGEAFGRWLDHHRDRAAWRSLDQVDRSRFQKVFKRTYALQLNDLLRDVGEHVYSLGYEAGWDYGAFIAYEWSFRKGYHEGFESALGDRSESAFRSEYPRLYHIRYEKFFQELKSRASLESSDLGVEHLWSKSGKNSR